MIWTISLQQFLLLRRQRVLFVITLILIVVTMLAGVLGWSSNHTIGRVFDEASRIATSGGTQPPANPFLLKPHLSSLSNMVVYVPLIGALLSIVLGYITVADENVDGIGRLLFSRPINHAAYTVAKITSSAAVLIISLLFSMLIAIASLLVINHSTSLSELVRVAVFYGVSWLYLMIFVLIGMSALFATKRRSLALLVAIGAWLVITFGIPQITSGLRPTQSLNPMSDPINTTQAFFGFTSHFRTISLVEQFKEISGRVLQTSPSEAVSISLIRLAPIFGVGVLLALLLGVQVKRHNFASGVTHE